MSTPDKHHVDRGDEASALRWLLAAVPRRSSARWSNWVTSTVSRSTARSARRACPWRPSGGRSRPVATTRVRPGVTPRPGDSLFFGQVAAELVEKAECSLFLVTGEAFVPPADRDASLEGLNSKAQKAA